MSSPQVKFQRRAERPLVIAGPCMAETEELLHAVAEPMKKLAADLKFDYVFKASFDKANRTSIDGYRGPGIDTALQWFQGIRTGLKLPVLTDIHETHHVNEVAAGVDVLQIPAFLCRQTDLIVAAALSKKAVNIKKGQFLAPEGSAQIAKKVVDVCQKESIQPNFALTERGASFGYGNLVVDMRSFPVLATNPPGAVIFDITHSTQQPGAKGDSSGGQRQFAPVLARAATATGYLDGFFLEVHSNPSRAKSDAAVQLSIAQAEAMLRQIIPLWYASKNASSIDKDFTN